MNRRQKGEGFAGQRIVVLPRPMLARTENHPLLRGVMPTDIGYFPKASGHLRERSAGAAQAIFIFSAAGQGWCEIAGFRHEIQPGEMLVIPPETAHSYGADLARPWTIYWFHAQGELLGDFLQELEITAHQPVFALGNSPQFLGLFEEVLDLLDHGYTTTQLLGAAQALAHLLAVLVRERRQSSPRQTGAAQRIAQSIAYMKQHLHQPLPLDALAAMANLSRSRYVELFKRRVGYAPIDYFIRLRMHRACQLLDTANASIKEIAAQLGYGDPLYFSRVFRSVHDCTPTDYRRTRKG